MMSAWNTDSGVSIHAELIGREWIKDGHTLFVFSHIKEDFHGDGFTRKKDEEFVIRCFGKPHVTNFFDPRPILKNKYDVFIVQDLRQIPYLKLAHILPILKRKSKITAHIVHENHLPEESWFYMHDWDLVIYFDKRQAFLKEIYEDKAHYIPFPCAPLRNIDKEEAREELKLPKEKKIFLIFAQRGYKPYFPEIPDKIKKDLIFILLIRKGMLGELVESYSKSPHILIREEETLSWERLDLYAGASDGIVLHKFKSRGYALISTTAAQLIGAQRPILVPKHSDFFNFFKGGVLEYGDYTELGIWLSKIVEDDEEVRQTLRRARKIVEKNSSEKIAKEYINLFEKFL